MDINLKTNLYLAGLSFDQYQDVEQIFSYEEKDSFLKSWACWMSHWTDSDRALLHFIYLGGRVE